MIRVWKIQGQTEEHIRDHKTTNIQPLARRYCENYDCSASKKFPHILRPNVDDATWYLYLENRA